MNILHNPIAEMYGPKFLLFYGTVIAIASAVCWLILWGADSTRNLPLPLIPANPNPYEIAYFQGAEKQLALLVVFNLIERGLLQVDKKNIERLPNCDNTEQLTSIEQEVFAWFTEPRTAIDVSWLLPRKIQQHCQVYEQILQHQQLLYLPAWNTAAKLTGFAVSVIILSLGGYKFLVALVNGHHNVAFLIIMTVFGLILVGYTCTKAPRLSHLGRRYLQQFHKVFEQLQQKAQNGVSPSLTEYDLLVALFGANALSGTPYDSYSQMFINSSSTYISSSSSGGCSSSCGSGCGSSCGGGCGGCGS